MITKAAQRRLGIFARAKAFAWRPRTDTMDAPDGAWGRRAAWRAESGA